MDMRSVPAKVGPYSDLVGKRLEDLQVSGSSDVEIEFKQTVHKFSEDPGDLSPCLFEGRVRTKMGVNLPVHIAIAVNGTIQAVTRTYLEKDLKDQWSAIVPEQSFQTGENDLRMLVISEKEGKITFQSTTVQ